MDFDLNSKTVEHLAILQEFMDEHIYPNEKLYWQQVDEGDRWATVPIMEELKVVARERGLSSA